MGEPTVLELTSDEALVLFEFLSRFSENDTLAIEDQAEERVLWKLLGLLEERLAEPFDPEWAAIISAARNRLRGEI
ncbi:hypothetical protein [Lacipirellula sp.]|uniref:hypothetical protein n=1 Tax=Lacipirellula sp. TaxID=2691419 RepID=UPI003D15240E